METWRAALFISLAFLCTATIIFSIGDSSSGVHASLLVIGALTIPTYVIWGCYKGRFE